MYINIQTLTQHSESALRALFPNTGFPSPFVAPDGYAFVFPAPPPTYDAATQFAREIAPELTAKGHYEQRWEIVQLDTESVADNQARAASAIREAAKSRRTVAVAAITVTTAAGNTFDGDEVSQGRMARAIVTLQATNTPATLWVLHDNSAAQVTLSELCEALALAGAEQTRLWLPA